MIIAEQYTQLDQPPVKSLVGGSGKIMGAKVSTPPTRNYSKIITGQYTGNGGDDRSIDIGIDLASKDKVYIIVKGDVAFPAVHLSNTMSVGEAAHYDATANAVDKLQAINATGFQVGNSSLVNQSAIVYHYVVIWEEDF